MLKPVLILASLVALLPVMVSPAYSTIYVWTDDSGVRNVTNDPRRIPSGVQVQMIEENSYGEDVPAPVTETSISVTETPAPATETPVTETPVSVTETPTPVTETLPGDVVTQGEFAVQLAAELALGEGLSPQAAANRLSALRIAPRLSGWELDAPMTQALFDRLSKLTVAAANEGRIPIGLEEARFAFDSATALARISKHHVSIARVPALPPHIIEEVPVTVYVPPPVVHRRVIFVGAHFGHGVFHHGLRHKHHHGGFRKHHHGLKHKHHHGVHHKHAVHLHPIHKRHRHHANARFRFKHKHGFNRHKLRAHRTRFDSRGFKVTHRNAHARALRGATRHGHVSVRRLGAGRGVVSARRHSIVQRRVGRSVRMRSVGGRRMGSGRRGVSRLR